MAEMEDSVAKRRRLEDGADRAAQCGQCCMKTRMENARLIAAAVKQQSVFEAQTARLAARISALEADRRELLGANSETAAAMDALQAESAEKVRTLTARADSLSAREREARIRELDARDSAQRSERLCRQREADVGRLTGVIALLESELERLRGDTRPATAQPCMSPAQLELSASTVNPHESSDSLRTNELEAENRRLAYELRVARDTEQSVLPSLQDEVHTLRTRLAAMEATQDALLAAEAEIRKLKDTAGAAGHAELRRELEMRTIELARLKDELGRRA